MFNFAPERFKQLQEAFCRPEGTFSFTYSSQDIFNKEKKGGILFQVPAREHLFMLVRDDQLLIHFYHSSPGTGTRVATIDLNNVSFCERLFVCFTWSPSDISLYLGPLIPGEKLLSSSGVISHKQFRVGKDGVVYQIGNHNVEILGANIYKKGEPVLQPTALDAWKETLKAVEILGTGESAQGHIFEIAITNLILVMVVTGFEAYAKKRLLEIEQEGVRPEVADIIDSFYSQKEKSAGIAEILRSEAMDKNKTILQLIVENNVINFQNYEKCKLAYKKTYQLIFGKFGLPPEGFNKIKRFIRYRHRIVHISALIGILNQPEVPPEEPVFSSKALVKEAIQIFDSFINTLHNETLKLRRNDRK